jgi:PTH1 family peptidyl-tRNA hydrolase
LKIVLGLGNPGSVYRSTRHNLGFWVLDRLAARLRVRFRVAGTLKRYAWVAARAGEHDSPLLAKPRTFMNRSGRAAAALLRHYHAEVDSLVVVYDDADLELGRLRLRGGGGAGGHNGVRSLIEVLGTGEFARIRLGVRGTGRDERDLADYVLDEFDRDETRIAESLAEMGTDAVEFFLAEGLEAAMNRFNGRRVGEPESSESNGPLSG